MTSNSTPEYISENKTKQNTNLTRYMHLNVHTELFSIAKVWKQAKCLPTDEWVKKMWYTHTHTHTVEYYSTIKKWNFSYCSNMDGLGWHYAKWNKSDRERQILYITYMWNLRNTQTSE